MKKEETNLAKTSWIFGALDSYLFVKFNQFSNVYQRFWKSYGGYHQKIDKKPIAAAWCMIPNMAISEIRIKLLIICTLKWSKK